MLFCKPFTVNPRIDTFYIITILLRTLIHNNNSSFSTINLIN